MFCDIVFSNENEKLISWLEGLEETCKKRIFENRTKWFENDLEEHDIENYLTSPYKIFKSGKQYVMRVNVPTIMEKCELKIYDENEAEVQPEELKENTSIVTILEFKGIRCSVRSFQFEIETKQMLVVAPMKLFEKCMIHVAGTAAPQQSLITDNSKQTTLISQLAPETNLERIEDTSTNQNIKHNEMDLPEIPSRHMAYEPQELLIKQEESVIVNLGSDKELVSDKELGSDKELVEIDFDLDQLETKDTVHLKKRDDVYYKMYKDAKRKAREAKILALSNYLEAKRIKTTYLLDDDISDEEDDENMEEEMNQLSSQM
jgi:hypothetical protein